MRQKTRRHRWFLRAAGRKQRAGRSQRASRTSRLIFEPLEDRRMLALLGIYAGPSDPPDISFASCNGSQPGCQPGLHYNSTTHALTVNTEPAKYFPDFSSQYSFLPGGSLSINICADNAGNLDTSSPGCASTITDLKITGTIDNDGSNSVTPGDTSGVLLTGQIVAFGYKDSNARPYDFDFRFHVTGGILASQFSASDGDVGVVLNAKKGMPDNNQEIDPPVFTHDIDGFEVKGDTSPPADVRIRLQPPEATNEVNQPHTITAIVEEDDGLPAGDPYGDAYSGYGPVAGATVTFTSSPSGAFVGPDSCTTNAAGQCSVVINSSVATTITVNGHTTVIIPGFESTPFVRDTDPTTIPPAGYGGSGPAVKHYVDANISITPNDVNGVGDPHTFTIVVNAFPDGAGSTTFGPITTSVSPVPNTSQSDTCATPVITNGGNTATCTLTINSSVTGVFTANAYAQITMGSVTVSRDTDPATATVHGTGGTDSATKRYVDARIKIAPNATNEVGQPHTFTVTVEQDDGLPAGAPGGDASTGFGPAPVGNVDVTLTGSNGAVPVLNAAASTCDDNQPSGDNLDNNGQCITVFTSNSAGQVTGHAAVDVVVSGVTLHRETNGLSGNSGDAVKTFVDAHISITPNGSNPVGSPHTFTVHVDQNAGNGSGFVPATVGNVDVTLTNGGGASAVIDTAASTCDDNQPSGDNLDASGNCTLVFTSNTAGTVTGNATVTLVVGGVTVTRATGDSHTGDSGPAVKRFYDFHTNAYTLVSNLTGSAVIEDRATLAGATTSPPAGGTITFTLYNPGNMPIYTDVVTVNCAAASCTYDTATDGINSGGYATLNSDAGGTYYWQVHYSGDANNAPADDNGAPPTGDTNEQVTIIKRESNGQLSGHKDLVTASPNLSGRMTGGGSIFTDATDTGDLAITGPNNSTVGNRVTHGFEIHCDPQNLPNNLEINWHGRTQEDNFHLSSITKATCQESTLVQYPPNAPFDTYIGIGTGSLNGIDGYSINWTFTDGGIDPPKGEPGKQDTARYLIWQDLNSNGIVDGTETPALSIGQKQITSVGTPIGPTLMFGNHQAHAENKATSGTTNTVTIPGAGFVIHVFATVGLGGPEDTTGYHASTVTDVNGNYSFTGLAPGNYAVCEEYNPTIYMESSPTSGYQCQTLATTLNTPQAGDPAHHVAPGDILGPNGYAVTVDFNTVIPGLNFTNQKELFPDGRMTGGGSIFTRSGDIMNNQPVGDGIRITHGFEIHCNPDIDPQRLEINWIPPSSTGSKESHFHLLDMVAPTHCKDTAIIQAPPDAPIDTYFGYGVGRFTGTIDGQKYNNATGFRIEFTFTDGGPNTDGSGSYCAQAKGEPGICDTAKYFVYQDANSNGMYDSGEKIALQSGPTFLNHGNHQAHVEHKKTVTTTKIQNSIDTTLDSLDQPDLTDPTIVSLTDTLIGQFDQLTAAENNDPPGLAGYVYVDDNNNGVFDATEKPLAGVTLSLLRTDITGQGQTNYGSVTTDSTGWYGFGSLPLGSTWKLTETQPSSYLDGKDTAGTLGGTAGNDVISNIVVNGTDGNNNNFGERTPATISGYVYNDLDDNGLRVTGEPGLAGATLTLTGTASINGQAVTKSVTTDSTGFYVFAGLEPGTYKVTETQPGGTADGKDAVGTISSIVKGTLGADNVSNILIKGGEAGINYNFGELAIYKGLIATIGFWHNAAGQGLIKSFGNTTSGLTLANTLATNLPNLFGKSAPAYSATSTMGTNLTNRSNADVASYFLSLFGTNGQNAYAQVLATALSIFATTNSQNTGKKPTGYTGTDSQTLAKGYGFTLSNTGAGAAFYAVPAVDWPAFGLTSATATQSLNNLVTLANKYAFKGVINNGDTAKTNQTKDVFTNINNLGTVGVGLTQVVAGSDSATIAPLGRVYAGTYVVSVDGYDAAYAADEHARVQDAISQINAMLGSFGVKLVEAGSGSNVEADIQIDLADTTAIGNLERGVLGYFQLGGDVTIVNAGNWYFGSDPRSIGRTQYDFQTVVMHELLHGVGLGESADANSVMCAFLNVGQVHRELTAMDLTWLRKPEDAQATAAPSNPSHNVQNALDVDGDSVVAPLDALMVINYLNSRSRDAEGESAIDSMYLDVNDDHAITPLDTLMIINALNSRLAVRAPSDGADSSSPVDVPTDAPSTSEPDPAASDDAPPVILLSDTSDVPLANPTYDPTNDQLGWLELLAADVATQKKTISA